MSHVLLRNPRLQGWEYGMLRALENEIVRQSNAQIVEVPDYGMDLTKTRLGHGMRFSHFRSYLPKKNIDIEADVLWYVLMGPENYELDLFSGWDKGPKHKITYLYDTLEQQLPLVERLFTKSKFDITITSFSDALSSLEKATGRKWFSIEQAVPDQMFKDVPLEKRGIDFSSYGRRMEGFHRALMEYCEVNKLYYDYSTHQGRNLTTTPEEFYRQYGWHLNHSIFTVSWPVEITSPSRAGRLHPITCRWFEAGMAGTIILGQKPNNPDFDKLLHPDLVIQMDPHGDKKSIWQALDNVMVNQEDLYQRARKIRTEKLSAWNLSDRVKRMLSLLDLKTLP